MYISKFNKPAYLLDTIDRIACEFGVPTLTEQLEADRAAAASTVSGILTATAVTSTINRVIANIATVASVPMDELSDDTFCYVIADDNPIEFEDPEKFAFRFGAGYIVVTRSTCAFDVRHDCIDAQTTPLDLIVLACAMKMSQRDCYVLLRYNDIAMMANPVFASGNYTDASTGRLSGDAWKLFDGFSFIPKLPALWPPAAPSFPLPTQITVLPISAALSIKRSTREVPSWEQGH